MISETIGKLAQRWIRQRIPRRDEIELGRRNIFVLPTREGMLFCGLLVICLLTGINYQNSVIYLFTFILGAVFYGTILQTFQNLDGLRVSVISLGQGVAGEPLPVALRLTAPDGSMRPALNLSFDEGVVARTVVEGHRNDAIVLSMVPVRRGRVVCPRIRLETDFPFGLIRVWTWIRPASTGVATPRPVQPPAHVMSGESEEEGEALVRRSPGDTDTLLRPYRAGDSLKRVNWKLFARTGQMVVSDWDAPSGDPRWLNWDDFPGVDPELRLSYLAWRVEDCAAKQAPWGLAIPGVRLEPDLGDAHRRESLRALGLYGESESVGPVDDKGEGAAAKPGHRAGAHA